MVRKCAEHLDGSLVNVCKDQFYWKGVEELLEEELQSPHKMDPGFKSLRKIIHEKLPSQPVGPHLPSKVFKTCKIILLSTEEFDGLRYATCRVRPHAKKTRSIVRAGRRQIGQGRPLPRRRWQLSHAQQ